MRLAASLVIFAALAAQAQPLKVAVNGKSDYEIILAPDAYPITRRAADDLQQYIAKATGAKLPIRAAAAPGPKPAIVVGACPAAQQAGLDLAGLRPEGFIIKTAGPNLHIAGRDSDGPAGSDHWRFGPQAGTWHGVSQFLESRLGVRWFFPGEMGEYVPKRDSLTVAPCDETDAPKLIYRRMAYVYNNDTPPARRQEVIDWQRRNRAGFSIIWNASHSWIEHFKGETYFAKHPDWFALVDGRRLGHRTHGLQMCVTNKEALDEFARVIIEYGKKNPGVMFPLSPNDGGDHCQCPNCRALDTGTWPDGQPKMTDRYLTYCNEIAKRVCAVLPDQQFGFYAYSYYAEPPQRVKWLHPNVHVMEVMNGTQLCYCDPAIREYHLTQRLLPWSKYTNGRLHFYDHPLGMGNLQLPSMSYNTIRDLYKNLNQARVIGFSMNVSPSFGATGLDNYLYLKMAWDPAQDISAIYDEALRLCYGEAAAPLMRKYFALVEERTRQLVMSREIPEDRGMGDFRRFPAVLNDLYPALLKDAAPLVAQALAAAADPAQRARVQLHADNLEYSRMTVDLWQLSKKARDPNAQLADVVAARDLAVKRLAWLKKNDQTNLCLLAPLLAQNKNFNFPFEPSVYDYLIGAKQGAQKTAQVPLVSPGPAVDGKLEDPCWAKIPAQPANLDKNTAKPSDVSTEVRFARTATHLLVAVRCAEPLMDRNMDSIRVRGGNVWEENEVELFLDPGDTGKSYFQLCVNSLGTIFEKSWPNGKPQAWDSQASVAAQRGKDYWSVEISIPFAALGVKEVTPGDVWAANVCRVRATLKPSEYTCWSPTFGGFHQPERFGKLMIR